MSQASLSWALHRRNGLDTVHGLWWVDILSDTTFSGAGHLFRRNV